MLATGTGQDGSLGTVINSRVRVEPSANEPLLRDDGLESNSSNI